MNKDKNYYSLLGVDHKSTDSEIKKAYYKLSFSHHPDKSGDPLIFNEITEAYNVLSDKELRTEYDSKSKWGKSYNEYFELFDIKVDFTYEDEKSKLETFKKNEIHNIQINIGDNFDGTLEYERWVKCKGCDGTGKDLSAKILIKDTEGNILKTFDADDGCDFCEGSGKDYLGNDCSFCFGKGKVGINPCKKCKGERRILGKQKLTGIKLTGDETKIDAMGHSSKTEVGKVGYLLLKKIKE